jgi:hypothetical protein
MKKEIKYAKCSLRIKQKFSSYSVDVMSKIDLHVKQNLVFVGRVGVA